MSFRITDEDGEADASKKSGGKLIVSGSKRDSALRDSDNLSDQPASRKTTDRQSSRVLGRPVETNRRLDSCKTFNYDVD